MNKLPAILITAQIFLMCGSGWSADLTPDSIITTYAGAAHIFSGDGRPALNAALSGFQQIQTDRNGNIIFADTGNDVVSRLNSDSTLTVLAGNGIIGFSGEGGPARSASLRLPTDAVMDKAGNLYIYDSLNFRIRLVTPDGVISTYAGTGVEGYMGDGGPATQAQIEFDGKMTIDIAGNLYFTDPVNSVVRRITPNGTISTYAGNGQPASGPDSGDNGQATQASLGLSLGGLAEDSAGNLYVAEDITNQIRKIAPNGIITTVAGSGDYGYVDGPALSAQFSTPYGIAVDASGNLYVADVNNGVVRKILGRPGKHRRGESGFRFLRGRRSGVASSIPIPGGRGDRRGWKSVHRRYRELPYTRGHRGWKHTQRGRRRTVRTYARRHACGQRVVIGAQFSFVRPIRPSPDCRYRRLFGKAHQFGWNHPDHRRIGNPRLWTGLPGCFRWTSDG